MTVRCSACRGEIPAGAALCERCGAEVHPDLATRFARAVEARYPATRPRRREAARGRLRAQAPFAPDET